jgi:hypothetical protein
VSTGGRTAAVCRTPHTAEGLHVSASPSQNTPPLPPPQAGGNMDWVDGMDEMDP